MAQYNFQNISEVVGSLHRYEAVALGDTSVVLRHTKTDAQKNIIKEGIDLVERHKKTLYDMVNESSRYHSISVHTSPADRTQGTGRLYSNDNSITVDTRLGPPKFSARLKKEKEPEKLRALAYGSEEEDVKTAYEKGNEIANALYDKLKVNTQKLNLNISHTPGLNMLPVILSKINRAYRTKTGTDLIFKLEGSGINPDERSLDRYSDNVTENLNGYATLRVVRDGEFYIAIVDENGTTMVKEELFKVLADQKYASVEEAVKALEQKQADSDQKGEAQAKKAISSKEKKKAKT